MTQCSLVEMYQHFQKKMLATLEVIIRVIFYLEHKESRLHLGAGASLLDHIIIPKFCHRSIHLSACLKLDHSSSFIFPSFFFIFFVVIFFFCSYFYSFFPLLTNENCHFLAETFFDTIKYMKRPRHIEL